MGGESDAASITATPQGGVTDEGDAIGAETAEHGTTRRAGAGGGAPARSTEGSDKDGTSALKVDVAMETEVGALCRRQKPKRVFVVWG